MPDCGGGGKVIYDCHEYQSEGVARLFAQPSTSRYEKIKSHYEQFERFCTRRIDGVVTVNEELGARFRRDSDKVAVLPNYPALEEFEGSFLPPAKWSDLLQEKEVLLYAGYVSPDRGVRECVQMLGASALRERKNTVLLLAGAVSKEERNQLTTMAERLEVKDRVFFTDRIPHDEMQKYIQLGTIGMNLILQDRYENNRSQRTKVFQYAAAGLPVVSSPVEASRRLVCEMGNGIIVNPEKPEESAEQIAGLLANPERMKSLGVAGRRAFLGRFNLGAVLPRMMRLYDDF